MKFPATLGACVDAMYEIRTKRLQMEEKVETLRSEQKELEDHIIESLKKQGLGSGRGSKATATITKSSVPTVTDYTAFTTHILKTGAIELLERRPSKSACAERWEAGESVPGITAVEVTKLSLTKAGK